jgi:four helix bundle protein
MRNFRELDIWKESILIAKEVYLLMASILTDEKFGLISQIKRNVVYISPNIAECCSRKSDKYFARFLEISLGSYYELETQLILCLEFQFITNEKFQIIDTRVKLIQRKIASFIHHLNQ